MTTTATTWLDIGITIHGEYHRAEPDCGVHAGWSFDGIDGMVYEEVTRTWNGIGQPATVTRRIVDLFDGVNVNSPDIRRFIQNLHNIIDHDAARGEIAAVGE